MTCLSKGLGAPVGSLVAGSADDMEQARLERKRLGGIDAPSRRARRAGAPRAARQRRSPCRRPRPGPPARRRGGRAMARDPRSGAGAHQHRRRAPAGRRQVVDHLAAEGVLASTLGPARLRFVTHLHIDDVAIDRACRAVADGALIAPTCPSASIVTSPSSALAVYAHPDDPEVSCGGTLARWARGGAEVHLVVVNRGEKGAATPATDADALAAVRAAEVAEAAQVLGLAGCELLGLPDGETENDLALGRGSSRSSAGCGPRSSCAPTPRRCTSATGGSTTVTTASCGFAVLDAVAPAAASPLYFPEPARPTRSAPLYLSGTLEPDTAVAICDVFDGQGGGAGLPPQPARRGGHGRAGARAGRAAGARGRARCSACVTPSCSGSCAWPA